MLSTTARSVFDEADQGKALLVLNPVVLAEFYYVPRKAGLDANFAAYVAAIESNPIYRLEPITWADLGELPNFTEIPEMHDRLIAIQAVRLGATLVTRDPVIQACSRVTWCW
jgi:predicted nucleic acid-binding protein